MEKNKYLESKSLSIYLFVFLFLMYAVVYMTKSMFSSALAIIVEEGVMTKSQTGLITAAFWFAYAPFQIVGGFAADKYSPYKLIVIGLSGAIISNVIIYFNQNYYIMMAAWIFNAIAQFGLWPAVFKVVSTQLTHTFRATAVFWMLFSTSVGLGMSMLVASFVKDWRDNFLLSAISLVVMMLAYMILNKFFDKKMVEQESDKKNIGTSQPQKAPMLPLMMSSGVVAFLIVCLLRVAIDNGIKMMTPVMLMETYPDLPAVISTRLGSILVVFSAIGIFVTGIVKTKVTKSEPKAQILLYGVSLIPLAMVCFVGHIHYLWILVALSLSIVLVHGAAPFSQSFVALHFEKYGRIGTVSGILNATASVGNILASYIFAKMAEVMPWEGVAISWFISIILCVVLCVVVLPRWTKFTSR